MEAIKKYIDRFFAGTKRNVRYDIKVKEWTALTNSGQRRIDIVETSFDFGYAKGYRAAMAEMKKGGAI